MAELKIVCDPGLEDVLAEFVSVSGLRALSPSEAANKGYEPHWKVIPDIPDSGLQPISEKKLANLVISPDDVDPNNYDILPLRIVHIPRVLGRYCLQTVSAPSFNRLTEPKRPLMTHITAAVRDFRVDHPGFLTATKNDASRVGLHIDHCDGREGTTYLAANHGAVGRWHLLSTYMQRRKGITCAEERIRYIREHPPTEEDEAIWLFTPPPSSLITDGLELDWAVTSPVAKVGHDGSLYGTQPPPLKFYVPDVIQSGAYFLDIDPVGLPYLPSQFYPRPEQDEGTFSRWKLEAKQYS